MRNLFGVASSRLITGIVLLGMLVTAWSCDDSDELGLELTPPGERFAYHKDTSATVRMTTLLQDSLTTERRNPVLLGSAYDDVFGYQQAGFVTQLRLPSSNVEFGEGLQLDSAVLLLKYAGYYGDTTTQQHLKVYELLDDLVFDSTYYSNQDLSGYFDDMNPIAEKSFYPNPTGDSLAFRVDDEIGRKILEADTSHLADNNTFLEFFKGLYLATDPVSSGGAISYFNLAGGKSRLSLYYSNAEEDSLSYEVLINDDCAWINVFSHNYDQALVEPYINDSVYTNELVFIQGTAGLRAGMSLEFSDSLLQMAEKGIAINKAELILPIASEYVTDIRTKPLNLALYGAKADGTNDFIEDIFLGEDYYDGGFHPEKEAYVFNIARHVQNLLHPDSTQRIPNAGLFLVISDARMSANALVLRNSTSDNGIRLSLTYTLIN